jgi:hypothetical protein
MTGVFNPDAADTKQAVRRSPFATARRRSRSGSRNWWRYLMLGRRPREAL